MNTLPTPEQIKALRYPRCPKRDDNGHRCTKQVDHEGGHTAFGKKWEKSS